MIPLLLLVVLNRVARREARLTPNILNSKSHKGTLHYDYYGNKLIDWLFNNFLLFFNMKILMHPFNKPPSTSMAKVTSGREGERPSSSSSDGNVTFHYLSTTQETQQPDKQVTKETPQCRYRSTSYKKAYLKRVESTKIPTNRIHHLLLKSMSISLFPLLLRRKITHL
ncbi:hypothetical protein AAHE18_10G184400 [Arachis hypogaea]